MGRLAGRVLFGSLVVTLALGATAAAAAVPPPTLTGEALVAVSPATLTPHLAGTCNANPDGSTTLTYSVTNSPNAFGPYTGTFTENLTVTFGPQTGPVVPQGFVSGSQGFATGDITDLHATFTIFSPTGTVTGTKQFDPNLAPVSFPTSPGAENRGFCRDLNGDPQPAFPAAPPFYGYYRAIDAATVGYTAKITTAGGPFFDHGRTRVIIRNACADFTPPADQGPCIADEDVFLEIFQSDLAAPVGTPTTKDDCKNDGWRNFRDDQGNPFKNQGDCVSYVATQGKNKGAG